jgi:quercetin dioxygenase-like cupin family protein
MSFRAFKILIFLALAFESFSTTAAGQAPAKPRPFSCTMLASQRTQEAGCYVVANEELGSLPEGPLFWYLYTYPTLEAARQAKGSSAGTAVKSLGKIWLFKIGPAGWRPASGKKVAVVGPLTVPPAIKYTARYMEAVEPPRPGSHTPVHRHPGPEAWYVLQGSQCMQTPGKTNILRTGQTAFVSAGVPMDLSFNGSETERTLVLVLQDASKPWMTKANDWKPNTPCPP